MADLHLRVLRLVAKRRQRELDHDPTPDPIAHAVSSGRRLDLEAAAGRTKAHVAAAEARRRYPWPRRA
jgi:hypothetical protein